MNIKLIRSSIYKANGTLARFTGEMENGTPVFSAHGKRIVTDKVEKVSLDDVRAYMGR